MIFQLERVHVMYLIISLLIVHEVSRNYSVNNPNVLNSDVESCPFGPAWASKAYNLTQSHSYLECSARGNCDRITVRLLFHAFINFIHIFTIREFVVVSKVLKEVHVNDVIHILLYFYFH